VTASVTRYCLVHNNDGHEYVVPSDSAHEWWRWLDEAEAAEYIGKYDTTPEYAKRVDGLLTFTDPRCR
jgi:hypothetical protein